MHKALLIILFSICTAPFGKTQEFETDQLEYYKLVTLAESHILDSSLQEALSCLEQAFVNNDFIRARDLFKAAQLSVLLNESEKTPYYIIEAAKLGVCDTYFLLDPIMKSFHPEFYSSPEFNIAIESLYSHTNQDLASRIDSMIRRDQEINTRLNNSRFFPPLYWVRHKKWKRIIKSQGDSLFEIIREYGYPGEKLLRVECSEFNEISGNTKKVNYITRSGPFLYHNSASTILIHYCRFITPAQYKVLINEVSAGRLAPDIFAKLSDFLYRYNKHFEGDPICRYNEYFVEPGEDLSVSNRNRQRIGLESVAELNKRQTAWIQRNRSRHYSNIYLR